MIEEMKIIKNYQKIVMIAAVKMKNHLLMKVDQVKNQAAMSQIHRLLDQTLKKMMMMSIGKIRTIIKMRGPSEKNNEST